MSSLSFNGDGTKLTSVSFENTQTKEKKDFPTDAAFVAIGQIPTMSVSPMWSSSKKVSSSPTNRWRQNPRHLRLRRLPR
jgi:alkyl hydroperoxide reductase subunit AhpF